LLHRSKLLIFKSAREQFRRYGEAEHISCFEIDHWFSFVEQWIPPDVMFGLSNKQVVEILNKIREGMEDGRRYTHATNAKTRAAWKVVVDVVPALNEKQAREIIKTWMKEKVLVLKTYRNEKDRKDEEGLRRNGVDEGVPF
jgi:ribosomal silencing factor RsfS